MNISIIGSGNVATHLGKALYKQGCNIQQIFSRRIENAEELANQINAEAINDLASVKDTDLILFSVPDDVLTSLYERFQNFKGILAHTSGVSDIDFLPKNDTTRVAYFYSLQTFRKEQTSDLKNTPFFINARFEDDQATLVALAKTISNNVKIIDAIQKKQLHLSAVVVNNFVNHLFGLTKENLQKNNLDLTDLLPIIETTVKRAIEENPFEIQTGPAIRNDEKTIEEHLSLIEENEEFQKVYRCLTESIKKKHEV